MGAQKEVCRFAGKKAHDAGGFAATWNRGERRGWFECYGRLRAALALWNRKTNIHVSAQYIKALIDAARDFDDNNPNFRFYFDGTPNMSLGQYKLPMSSWDDSHKKLLAQQYTQEPWVFQPNSKYGHQPRLAPNAISYFGSFWENYTREEFRSAFP